MKINIVCAALSVMILLAACRKDTPLIPVSSSDTYNSTVDERCGCLPPAIFEVQNITTTSVDISWHTMPEATAYLVEVSLVEFQPSFFKITEESYIPLSGLIPGSTYKYRVSTICGSEISGSSEWMEFGTKSPLVLKPQLPDQKNVRQPIYR